MGSTCFCFVFTLPCFTELRGVWGGVFLAYCCCCSVAQFCLTLWDPMDCSTPGFPVLHYLLDFAQIMSIESMMPSNHLNPLSPPCPPALNLSQHQGLFQWDSSSHQGAKLLDLQHQSFPRIVQGWFPLGFTSLISLQFKGLSRVFSNTTVQKHQFFGAQPSLRFNSHTHTWLLEKP